MADFNNKNTNGKKYNNNTKGDYRKDGKKNFASDKKFDDNKNFKKPYDKRPYEKKPAQPQQPVRTRRPKGVDAPDHMTNLIEYKMSAGLADTILKADKTRRPPQEVLCEYVNTQCGLMGFCVRVSYF